MDTALQRPVAVKITTLECVGEARRVAQLQHHGIVAVHDVGQEAGHCFIVFDLVEDTDLARRIKENRPGWQEAARIVAESPVICTMPMRRGSSTETSNRPTS